MPYCLWCQRDDCEHAEPTPRVFEPEPVSSVPDYCEPIIGWRVWGVQHVGRRAIETPPHVLAKWPFDPYESITFHIEEDYRLESGGRTRWPPFEPLVAEHKEGVFASNDDRLRGLACTGTPCQHFPVRRPGCGIYAYKTWHDLASAIEGVNGNPFGGVIGQVALWGTVVEHEHGYRATLAYPHRIVWALNCDGAAVAKSYGIDYQEDTLWKSVLRNSASEWSRYAVQYQAALLNSLVRPVYLSGLTNIPPPPQRLLASPPSPPASEPTDEEQSRAIIAAAFIKSAEDVRRAIPYERPTGKRSLWSRFREK